jgi:hypothetical protein
MASWVFITTQFFNFEAPAFSRHRNTEFSVVKFVSYQLALKNRIPVCRLGIMSRKYSKLICFHAFRTNDMPEHGRKRHL